MLPNSTPGNQTLTTINTQVWRLAAPIIVANISVPLLGIVDTAVVGQLPGPHYIGGVAVAALVFQFIYWGFGFLRMGTTGFTAQALGAGDADEVRATLARAVLIASVIGIGLIAVQVPVGELAFRLIDPGARVEPLAREYYSIRIWGAPAALINYALLGWFIGIGNTRAVLIIQVAMNGVNIILDLWFVIGLDLGVSGVAWATLVSEIGAVLIGAFILRRRLVEIGGRWRRDLITESEKLRRTISVNGNIFVRTFFLLLSFSIFTSLSARMGETVLAANAILLNFQTFMAYALDGFAHAAEVLAGKAIGANNARRFRDVFRATQKWAFGFSLTFCLAYLVGGGWIIDAMSTDQGVRAMARTYLPWVVISPLVSVWSFHLDGIFIGATRSREMRNGMIISFAVYIATLAAILPWLGSHGLWFSLMVFMAVRAVTLGVVSSRIERAL